MVGIEGDGSRRLGWRDRVGLSEWLWGLVWPAGVFGVRILEIRFKSMCLDECGGEEEDL